MGAQGTLRVLLVLLHDLPEFLCEHHFELVSHVPTSCVQMRNLILSAFPRPMRLPDPFTPNLKARAPAFTPLEGPARAQRAPVPAALLRCATAACGPRAKAA